MLSCQGLACNRLALTKQSSSGKGLSILSSDPIQRYDTAPIDRFRSAIIADRSLQDRLVAFDAPDCFVAAALAEAQAIGIALDAATLSTALHPDPLGLDRFGGRAPDDVGWPTGDWRPINLAAVQGEWVIDWAHFAGRRLTEPFYEESLRIARARPFNRLVRLRTRLSALVGAAPADVPEPDGLIFHLSRCGSTLVAQMIATIGGATVVAEPPPFDAVLQLVQANPDVAIEERIALLRAMAGALGRPAATGTPGPFVIKLDSWHTLALPLLRRAFPDTPWIFLYREPVDILVSHHRIRGMQAVPGTMPEGLYGIDDATRLPLDEYCARVLTRTCAGVLDHPEIGGGLLINYDQLPGAVADQILPHFGIAPQASHGAAMQAASARNAKSPREAFTADSATKRSSATDPVRAAAAFVADSYRRLEERRRHEHV